MSTLAIMVGGYLRMIPQTMKTKVQNISELMHGMSVTSLFQVLIQATIRLMSMDRTDKEVINTPRVLRRFTLTKCGRSIPTAVIMFTADKPLKTSILARLAL